MTDLPATDPQVQDLAWPLPPTCGVLGVALVWYLPRPADALDAASEVTCRQAVIWQAGEALAAATGLLVTELIASAVRHGCVALYLELSRRAEGIAVAVREPSDTGWAALGSVDPGLGAAAALTADLTVRPVPGSDQYAYTAVAVGLPVEAVGPEAPVGPVVREEAASGRGRLLRRRPAPRMHGRATRCPERARRPIGRPHRSGGRLAPGGHRAPSRSTGGRISCLARARAPSVAPPGPGRATGRLSAGNR